MTIYQTGRLIQEYYLKRLRRYERKALDGIMDGVAGLGEPTDHELTDYLSEKQINFIKVLGKRLRIK